MAELTGPARGFDNARRDLDVIAERIEVVFLEGWWPTQPDHDRPSPAVPNAGSRYDVGQGSYRARQSWRALVDHLAAADVGSGAVLAQLAGSGPYSAPERPQTFEAVRSCVLKVRARLAG